MNKTISRVADRLGDAMATAFTILALLLVPHATVRAIIGAATHQWTPFAWLVLHITLTVTAFVLALACYALSSLLAPDRPEAY